MPFEWDHVFVCVAPDAAEASLLDEFGLIRGSGRNHAGQGTRNIRYFFDNAYLELLWVCDPNEAQSPDVQRTGLWQRCQWRENGDCPFGIGLRSTGSTDSDLPFQTWEYRPAYVPVGTVIQIATNSENVSEPLLFVVPHGPAPHAYSSDRREPLDHPSGIHKLTGLKIALSTNQPLSPEMISIMENKIFEIETGQAAHLKLTFDNGYRDDITHFDPALPLSIRS